MSSPNPRPPQPRILRCAALLLLAACLPSQRGVRTLTSIGASNPVLSPGGGLVAFKTTSGGVTALAVIAVAPNSKPLTLVADSNLSQFLWTPDSTALYYQVGSTVYYVLAGGSTPRQIATIPGVRPRIFDIDSKDKLIIGTRSDASGGGAIFILPTSGSTVAKDIVVGPNDHFGDLDLDPSDKRITYTSQVAQSPFDPIDIRAVDIDGQNDVSLSGGKLPKQNGTVRLPRSLRWLDAGTTVLFTAANNGTWELMQVSATNSTPISLTAPPLHFQRSSVTRDGATALCLGVTPYGHTVPVVLPGAGGARVPLEPELDWVVAGDPSIDDAGRLVVFAGFPARTPPPGRPEVQLVELDREISVSPRPALQASVTFELPVSLGETGTLFVSTGLGPVDPKQQFKLPGITYAVALDPTVVIPLISAANAPAKFTATVPNDTQLINFTVYLQGLRVSQASPVTGDFTRYAELQFLK